MQIASKCENESSYLFKTVFSLLFSINLISVSVNSKTLETLSLKLWLLKRMFVT